MGMKKTAGKKPPIEVDLAKPESERWLRVRGVDVYVGLDELYPGDPGELSGASLRIMEFAGAGLNAYMGAHCVGFIEREELDGFLSEAHAGSECSRAFLFELYPQVNPLRRSGANLLFVPGENPELRLYFGVSHCLGVLLGKKLAAFLTCIRERRLEERIERPAA